MMIRQVALGVMLAVLVVMAGVVASATVSSQTGPWQDALRLLRHPDASRRLDALRQLNEAGYTPAAEFVAPLVTDPDDRVQFAAIDAVLTFYLVEPVGERRVISLRGSTRSRAQEAFDAGPLVRAAGRAPLVLIDALVSAMADETARIRFDAVHALGVVADRLPPAQAQALMAGLDHYDPVMRTATARVIGRLRTAEAGEKLVLALNDSSALVKRYAAESLGWLREERALQSLVDLVTFYKKGEMADVMLLALARIGHGSTIEVMRARLSDASPAARRAAAEGLGRLRDAQSTAAVTSMMSSDRDAAARLAAMFAVDRLGDPQSHLIAAALGVNGMADQACDYLFELGEPAIAGVLEALKVANESRHRANLVHVLGYLGTAATVPLVEPYLKDADPRVARAAANAVARLAR